MGLLEIIFSLGFFAFFPIVFVLAASIRVVQQYQRAVKFRLGKYRGVLEPGLNFIIPIIDAVQYVDIRILTLDIPRQQAITKDNVPITVDGVVFFKVVDPKAAIINVNNYAYAISEYAQTALRDVVGGLSLDEVLAERHQVGTKIAEIVDKRAGEWGLDVTDIRIQDIDMPEDLKRLMSRQASSEREKRANIIKSEGDRLAATNLAAAAKIMAETPGAMQLRTLQTVDGLGSTPSNTVILVPVDVLEAAKAFTDFQRTMTDKERKK